MAETDEAREGMDEEPEPTAGSGPSPAKGGRKRLVLVAAATLVLVAGGVTGAYLAGLADPIVGAISGDAQSGEEAAKAAEVEEPKPVFYELPEFIVNLNTKGRKNTYLKLRASLELTNADDVRRIEEKMPRIVDTFQLYLRELRVDDIQGSAGTYRLREELLRRINGAVAPAQVNDVLFAELLVQ